MEEKELQEKTTESTSKWGQSDLFPKPLPAIGLMVFLTFCACILVFFFLFRYQGFTEGWAKLFHVLQPIVFGTVIAYLVNPFEKFFEKKILTYGEKKGKTGEKFKKLARYLGITCGLLVFLAIVIGTISIVIPRLVSTIFGLVENLPNQIETLRIWLEEQTDNPAVANTVAGNLSIITNFLENWFEENIVPEIKTYIASFTTSIMNFFRGMLNLIIGFIVAVYILTSKEKFAGQFKKVVYAFIPVHYGNKVIRIFRKSNEIFGGFIVGKIIDSLIIGIIAFVVLSLMKLPYAVLLATIVGVTNIIPLFGPFIGAVPCLIILVLENPLHALSFLVFIIILQQVDGNIIGPKILGSSTGLSSFWVIFAILIGGGFFGVPGMLLGVPVFAVIYYLIERWIAFRLHRKNLPLSTADYVQAVKIDSKTNEIIYPENIFEEELDQIENE